MVLAHALVRAEGAAPSRWMLLLHGILGSGANWRTFAKQVVAARPGWGAVLVDLRLHGASQDFPPPHTLAACAADLRALEAEIGPVGGVLGHSFGGKVALEYLRERRDLEVAWVIDSTPSARPDARGSDATIRIVRLLETLPARFARREDFLAYVTGQGVDRPTAMWLAMSVKAAKDGAGYEWRADMGGIKALLDDYFATDEWAMVESRAGRVAVHLVAGGDSSVLDSGDRARAQRAALVAPHRVFFHIVPGAGHWVHVDAPAALLDLVVSGTPA